MNDEIVSEHNIWVTSDVHLGHANILNFCPNSRPYTDIDHMNREIVRVWNEYVPPDDDVWFLGDFCFKYDVSRAKNLFDRLNGHKKMIRGNHDKVGQQLPWEEVLDYKELTHHGVKFILFHYPIEEWRDMNRGSIHLHGHIHSSPDIPKGKILTNRYDIGWDYYQRPVNLNEFNTKEIAREK